MNHKNNNNNSYEATLKRRDTHEYVLIENFQWKCYRFTYEYSTTDVVLIKSEISDGVRWVEVNVVNLMELGVIDNVENLLIRTGKQEYKNLHYENSTRDSILKDANEHDVFMFTHLAIDEDGVFKLMRRIRGISLLKQRLDYIASKNMKLEYVTDFSNFIFDQVDESVVIVYNLTNAVQNQ